MKHEDDTLDYLDHYSKNNRQCNINQKKIIYRDIGKFTTKAEEKSSNSIFKILGIVVIALILFSAYKNTSSSTNNPILGKWRTNTIIGEMEIEFDRNTASALGGVSKVNYEIKDNKILVFDEDLKIGTYYIIHDKNTIYTELMGIKTIYKRIK